MTTVKNEEIISYCEDHCCSACDAEHRKACEMFKNENLCFAPAAFIEAKRMMNKAWLGLEVGDLINIIKRTEAA